MATKTSDKAAQMRTVDGRGRVTLGPEFANQVVILTHLEGGGLEITPGQIVPAREAWLHQNPQAIKAVLKGLDQAKSHQFAQAPDIDGDAGLAEQMGE